MAKDRWIMKLLWHQYPNVVSTNLCVWWKMPMYLLTLLYWMPYRLLHFSSKVWNQNIAIILLCLSWWTSLVSLQKGWRDIALFVHSAIDISLSVTEAVFPYLKKGLEKGFGLVGHIASEGITAGLIRRPFKYVLVKSNKTPNWEEGDGHHLVWRGNTQMRHSDAAFDWKNNLYCLKRKKGRTIIQVLLLSFGIQVVCGM